MKLDELHRMAPLWARNHSPQDRDRLRTEMEARGLNWGNMYQEMEMSHRFVDTHRDESERGDSVPLHSHSFYEILLCKSNSGVEYLLGPNRYRLQRGDLLFISPGISHGPLLTERLIEPYRREVIWISREFVTQFLAPFDRDALARWRPAFLLRTAGTPWETLGERIHDGVREAGRRGPGWEAYVAGNTVMVLTLLDRAMTEPSGVTIAAAEKPELLDLALAYIEAHLGEQLTLADTARHFLVSESKLGQTFRQRLGVSFYHCVTQRRLIAAKSLIVQGVPLKEVNERVGFSDYSTFFRAFKQEYGVSPSQFRKLQVQP